MSSLQMSLPTLGYSTYVKSTKKIVRENLNTTRN